MQARRLKSSKTSGNVQNFLDNNKVSHISGRSGWIDHPFKSLRPANMAAAELRALESRSLSNPYINGQYYVIWRDVSEIKHEILIHIQDGVTQITVTPIDWSFGKGDI